MITRFFIDASPVIMQLRTILIATSLALTLSSVSLGTAQPRLADISFKLGAIRNVQRDHHFGNDTYAIYPELQIGGPLVASEVFNWGLYWGYWDDGVEKLFPIADGITHSYR
ncbi:hypothetical protein MJD09_02145 [bacterium]|nr:hypothetical protein [bacterium]